MQIPIWDDGLGEYLGEVLGDPDIEALVGARRIAPIELLEQYIHVSHISTLNPNPGSSVMPNVPRALVPSVSWPLSLIGLPKKLVQRQPPNCQDHLLSRVIIFLRCGLWKSNFLTA